jgi:hypothetical protein
VSESLLLRLPGYRWLPNGQSALSGAVLGLAEGLDRLFTRWAHELGAEEHVVPPFLPVRALDRVGYFRAFPHLATFPVSVRPEPACLEAFARGAPVDEHGEVRVAEPAAIQDVLTPAACYHFYALLEGARLDEARILTTRATCFRREAEYRPLERQWSFSMREVACLGSFAEVEAFVEAFRSRLRRFFEAVGPAVSWEHATDPFFDPRHAPGFLLQRIEPVKVEMVAGGVAIGSVNLHRDTFGRAFAIRRGEQDAFSACVAFGLERWIRAVVDHVGSDPCAWERWLAEAEAHG